MPPASTARQFRTSVVSAIAAVLAGIATIWTEWLDSSTTLAVVAGTGIALAALLLVEPHRWPLPLLAIGGAITGIGLLLDLDFATALAPATTAIVGSVVGAGALRVYARGDFTLRRVADVGALAAFGAVAGAFAGAVVGVAVAKIGDTPGEYWRLVGQVGLANAIGVLLVSTALVSWTTRPSVAPPGRATEATILGLSIASAGVVAFRVSSDPMAYATVVLLVWAAIRFRLRGVSTAALAIAGIAEWATARGIGPLVAADQSPRASVLVLQTFVAVTVAALLFLAAALDERDLAMANRQIATDYFRRTFDSSPVAMALTTLEGVIVEANSVLCDMLGSPRRQLVGTVLESHRYREDNRGEHDPSQFTSEAAEHLREGERRYVAADGAIVWAEVSETRVRGLDGKPESRVVMLHDITVRKGLEEQLFHAQKMEAVGRLAGGVAHDFNNLLGVMRGHAEMLDDDLRVLGQARARLASMQRATEKAAAMTEELLTYSRRRADAPALINLHDVIASAHGMLLQLVGSTVSIDVRLDATMSSMHADPFRIEQALVNLVVNARDAMPTGGTLTIATANAHASDHAAPSSLVLSVADTGIGMTAEVKRRIFEPFFTTKPPGAGTGLGLPSAYRVVQNCGGTIEVKSEPGEGTTFLITLPVATGADHGDGLRAETILVVDDEADVRTVAIDMLRGSGYRVLEAADSRTALQLMEDSSEPVDLVLSDVVMPGDGGPELAEQIRERSPDTQVVFVSGYAEIDPGSPALRGATLLRKPLERSELLAEVEIALAQRVEGLRARSGTRHREL